MAEEPKVAQLGPYQVELQAGQEYWWCGCGKSQSQPFCDGAHKGTGIRPTGFNPETTGVYNLCGCKASDDKPYCDGAHNML